ncbi:hypothetical protein [Arthrobacter sp. H35-D1]|uniref:hypothetical protein n=1 Tax=Arthrobacter sp. H35-D1 TaxID=3046202 RepID=UPI0024BA2945|nr:hypothetical protein [Arthrobacter sp. H35-D1]MDJ0314068.1 hypothetical protein [Arthrobacter sp. H35-D1]
MDIIIPAVLVLSAASLIWILWMERKRRNGKKPTIGMHAPAQPTAANSTYQPTFEVPGHAAWTTKAPSPEGGATNHGGQDATGLLARDAAANLNEDQHRTVYNALLKGNDSAAARAYEKATGCDRVLALVSVAALRDVPQRSPNGCLYDAATLQAKNAGRLTVSSTVTESTSTPRQATSSREKHANGSSGSSYSERSVLLSEAVTARIRALVDAGQTEQARSLLSSETGLDSEAAAEVLDFLLENPE